jgi:hypothetical protein
VRSRQGNSGFLLWDVIGKVSIVVVTDLRRYISRSGEFPCDGDHNTLMHLTVFKHRSKVDKFCDVVG